MAALKEEIDQACEEDKPDDAACQEDGCKEEIEVWGERVEEGDDILVDPQEQEQGTNLFARRSG